MLEAEPTGQRGRNGRGIPFRRHRGDTVFLNTMIIAVSCSVLLVDQCCVASRRVWRFVVGAELAVQPQQRRTTVHDTLSSAGCAFLLWATGGCLEWAPCGRYRLLAL